MMRVVVVGLLLTACSPAKHADNAKPPAPTDGGVTLPDANVVDAAQRVTQPDASRDETFESRDETFDWDKERKRIDAARAARKGQMSKPRPNCGVAPCEAATLSIAAYGHRVGEWAPDKPVATFVLDVGTDDGVGPHYWGALLGKDGRPITRFRHVSDLETRKCVLRVEVADHPRGGLDKVMLIVDPPEDQRVQP